MRKNKNSPSKRKSAIKRATKRSNRLKQTKSELHVRKEKLKIARKTAAHKQKVAFDQEMEKRFNGGLNR